MFDFLLMIRQILNANMLKLIGKSFLSEKQKVNSYCIQIYCCQNVEKAHLCLEIAFNGMLCPQFCYINFPM